MSCRGYQVDVVEFEKAIVAKGYSTGELAEKAGVHRATISNIRKGKLPSVIVMGKLSRALGLNGDGRERIFFAKDLRET